MRLLLLDERPIRRGPGGHLPDPWVRELPDALVARHRGAVVEVERGAGAVVLYERKALEVPR